MSPADEWDPLDEGGEWEPLREQAPPNEQRVTWIWRVWPWYAFCSIFGLFFCVYLSVYGTDRDVVAVAIWTLVAAVLTAVGVRETRPG